MRVRVVERQARLTRIRHVLLSARAKNSCVARGLANLAQRREATVSTHREMRVREIFIALLTLDGWAQRACSTTREDGQRLPGRQPLPDLRAEDEEQHEAEQQDREKGSLRD